MSVHFRHFYDKRKHAVSSCVCLWIKRDDFDTTGRKNSCCVGKLTEGTPLSAYLNTSCIDFQSWSFVQNMARDFCFGIDPWFPTNQRRCGL